MDNNDFLTGFIGKSKEENKQESENLMWMLLTTMLLVGFYPADRTKESYLQGKVDAYEKIIRRML